MMVLMNRLSLVIRPVSRVMAADPIAAQPAILDIIMIVTTVIALPVQHLAVTALLPLIAPLASCLTLSVVTSATSTALSPSPTAQPVPQPLRVPPAILDTVSIYLILVVLLCVVTAFSHLPRNAIQEPM
jgi:hypothetical protein